MKATTRSRSLIAVGVVGALVVASLVFVAVRAIASSPGQVITADFSEAPGIYVGNHVDVLGIPVGRINAVTVHPTYVAVVMQVASGIKIPAQVNAVLMAPELVNDRYVQLNPVYRHGAIMADHSVIPMDRTLLPESVDQIISTLDQLVQALGPNGANSKGAVSRFLHDVSSTVGGNGPSFHTTVTALGQALSALSADGPALSTLLDNVGQFTKVAAANTGEFQAFANDLAGVTGVVAADHSDIGTILSSLQQVLAQVTTFVHNNQSSLGSTISNLDTFTADIAQQQAQLAQAFGEGGLVLQNLNNAIITNPNGTTALRIRYDPSLDTPAFVKALCGNELTRILNLGAEQAKSSELNLACAATSALAQITPPPDAPQGPDLSLKALMGSDQ